MDELKYKKYILEELILPEDKKQNAGEYAKRGTRILWLEDFIMKGAPSVILSWYTKATEEPGTIAHTHDFDEVIGFIGSDPDNPHDLGGEVEFWMDDEKYMLTRSCLILAPKGLKHCPLRVTRVDRPILFIAVSMSDKYYKIFDENK